MVLVADKRGYLPTSFKNNAQQQNSKHWAEINSQNAPKEGLVLGGGSATDLYQPGDANIQNRKGPPAPENKPFSH